MASVISYIFPFLLKLCIVPVVVVAQTSRTKYTNNKSRATISNTNLRRPNRKLQVGVTIGGTVYYDINQNGQRDGNEPGVPDVTIQIRSCSNERMGSTLSNTIGDFSVSLPNSGCYYARFDVSSYQFTEEGTGSDVNLNTGRTSNVELTEGDAHFVYAGIVPPEGSGITASPTSAAAGDDPWGSFNLFPTTPSPTVSFPPSTASPTNSSAPSVSPTVTSAPSECIVYDAVGSSIMSSSPILRSSFGMMFSVSTPGYTGEVEGEEEEVVQETANNGNSESNVVKPATNGGGGEEENANNSDPSGGEQESANNSGNLDFSIPNSEEANKPQEEEEDANNSPPQFDFSIPSPTDGSPTDGGNSNGGNNNNNVNSNNEGTRTLKNHKDKGNEDHEHELEEDGTLLITSVSFRVLSPVLTETTGGEAVNYYVWYRMGEYGDLPRGNLTGWTLAAEGNSAGPYSTEFGVEEVEGEEKPANETIVQEPLILDDEYTSGATPSDSGDYEEVDSEILDDGGMATVSSTGSDVVTYLYKVPESVFTPIEIPKVGGKVSFYVTLDTALMQYGGADRDEWDNVDVENAEYDPEDDARGSQNDMNVKIHVGEGVTSYPWTDIKAFYSPRRFLGKVWYEEPRETPCALHENFPSAAPTDIIIPEAPPEEVAPGGDGGGIDAAGQRQDIRTTFVTEIFLQQDYADSTVMNAEVQEAFEETMIDFLNEEWTLNHCVWATNLDVPFQKRSPIDLRQRRHLRGRGGGMQRRNRRRRGLQQAEVTVLEIENLIKGVAYDDDQVCPEGSTPATATTAGSNWEETMATLGIEYINANVQKLQERLRDAHPYFGPIFAVSANDGSTLDKSGYEEPPEETEDEFPIIPVAAGAAAGALLLLLLVLFCICRRRKRDKIKKEEEGKMNGGVNGSSNQKDLQNGDTEQGDSDVKAKDGSPGDDESTADLDAEPKSSDPIVNGKPRLIPVPALEEIIMKRGLPRRRSEPNMATNIPPPTVVKRTWSLGCLREIWVNLEKDLSGHQRSGTGGGAPNIMDNLLEGELYPVDDPDLLYFEKENHITAEDKSSPYIQFGGSNPYNLIDENEPEVRIEEEPTPLKRPSGGDFEARAQAPKVKVNPLVLQQVEMLEAKWKEMREEFDDVDSDEEPPDEDFDVNARVEQLMGNIEKLELERKMRLNELKRSEEEEEELARKRMVKGGSGINYDQEFKKDFVIRKKKGNKKATEDLDLDDMSSEEESESDEDSDGEFDVKWMRLKVPLAAQNPEDLADMVEKGEQMG